MERLIIRSGKIDDIPSIAHASTSSTSSEETKGFAAPTRGPYASSEELRKAWAKENRLKDGFEIVVAEKNKRVIGFIVFKNESSHLYIDNIDIVKDEQRKGAGRALVEYVENIAIANGCLYMKTDTTENAEGVPWKSYGFWTRMGYKDTGERLPTQWGFRIIPFVKDLEGNR